MGDLQGDSYRLSCETKRDATELRRSVNECLLSGRRMETHLTEEMSEMEQSLRTLEAHILQAKEQMPEITPTVDQIEELDSRINQLDTRVFNWLITRMEGTMVRNMADKYRRMEADMEQLKLFVVDAKETMVVKMDQVLVETNVCFTQCWEHIVVIKEKVAKASKTSSLQEPAVLDPLGDFAAPSTLNEQNERRLLISGNMTSVMQSPDTDYHRSLRASLEELDCIEASELRRL